MHEAEWCILYNIPYCKTKKVVLSYSYKEKVLNDFSDAKKHIGGKQKLPKNRPLQKKHPNDDKRKYSGCKALQKISKDEGWKKITHRNGFQKEVVKSNEREVANDDWTQELNEMTLDCLSD